MNITFIGGGNMASALIKGISGGDSTINVVDPNAEARARAESEPGVSAFAHVDECLPDTRIIVLAVKPQVMDVVLSGLAGQLIAGQLVISVAAGVTVAAMQERLGSEVAVIRTMPNTPALLGAGITGLYASNGCSNEQREAADELMSTVGETVWLDDERLMDVVTAISGSGPAYFYLLTESLARAGQQMGLPADTALKLAVATAHGAGLMAANSDVDVSELRRRVTSPGGTTQAALEAFAAGGFSELVTTAATAAVDRGRELSGETTS